MDKFAGLRAFTSAINENGFASAARKMGFATSSLTRMVDNLEQELGTTLINRSTRKLTLTAAGEVFYEQAKTILKELDLAEDNIRNLDDEPRGELVVTMPVVLGKLHIMPIITAFMKKYPNINLHAHFSDRIENNFEKDIDVSIRIGQIPTQNQMIAIKLSGHKRYVIGSKNYFKKNKRPKSPQDLKNHSCLVFDYGSDFRVWKFMKPQTPVETEEIEIKPSFVANYSEALIEGVLSDLGLALLPDWLVDFHPRKNELVKVLEGYTTNPQSIETSIYMLYQENRRHLKRVRVFVDWLKEHYK